MTTDRDTCLYCGLLLVECPDPVQHDFFHRSSEITWWRKATAAAVLTPDAEVTR